MSVTVVVLNVLVILTVMPDTPNAVRMPRVQIRTDILLFHKCVLVEVPLVTLTRYVMVTKMSVRRLRYVLTIRVNQLLVDLIACALMERKTILVLQDSGVQLRDHLCALIHRPLRALRGYQQ